MNRRQFLSFGAAEPRVLEVSCERLYMRYLDAEAKGADAVRALVEQTHQELVKSRRVRLKESFWLQSEALRAAFQPALDRFRAAGGALELR